MRLLRKPNVERAAAATEVRFGTGNKLNVAWHGATELLVRSPHVYLDWAVNEQPREQALDNLAHTRAVLKGERQPPIQWSRVDGIENPSGEVTIVYTPTLRCKPAFRPRSTIANYIDATFWGLWNELEVRVGAAGPEAMEALTDDLLTQIDWYSQHDVERRGGVAPAYAAEVGTGRRFKEQAEAAGLSVKEWRAFTDKKRSEVIERQSAENINRVADAPGEE